MDRPYVVTHLLQSLDGQLTGFPPDVGRYYALAARLPHDVVLTGSGTMVAAAVDAGVDLSVDDPVQETASDADGDRSAPPGDGSRGEAPLLVVVDSRGRLTRFDWLRAAGLWRDVLVAGSATTPATHRARTADAGVELVLCGEDRVDLSALLGHLHAVVGSTAVRVDAGAGLNAALLDAGLVDEVSVVLAPYLAGRPSDLPPGPPLPPTPPSVRLALRQVEQEPDDHLWLRYAVVGDASGRDGQAVHEAP
ncbi:RibD family protein [Egicoccus sp. AB-alg2]|uniref:RibD family protein n=1 Tax=Egicoccus sp. AB-alg2 TaxID=3242693 RepID=UPI00359DD564